MKSVTLYIPCYNAQKYIADCLTGVLKQSFPLDEILVIDDGSTDKTAEIASRYPVRVISLGKNAGLGVGRNTAVESARNEYIASLDADCIPGPLWLEKLMRNFIDEMVAGVGGKLVENNQLRLADRWRTVHMRQHWGDARIENPHFLFGSNNVFCKQAVIDAGMYNPACRTNNEDYELSIHLKDQGKKLVYDPEAVAYHVRTDTLRSVMRTYARWTFRGTGSKRQPDTIYNLGCKWYDNIIYMMERVCQDCAAKRFDFILLDIAVVFTNGWFDTRYYLKNKFYHTKR